MRKLIISLFVCLFLISMISAFTFDNRRNPIPFERDTNISIGNRTIPYNPIWEEYTPIRIKNAFGLGETIFEGAITEHTKVCEGYDCYSIIAYDGSASYSPIEDIAFYENINGNWVQVDNIDYGLYYQNGTKDVSYPIYRDNCVAGRNQTRTCSVEIIRYDTKKEPNWIEFNKGDRIRLNSNIMIKARLNNDNKVDWRIKVSGEWINEWAVWGAENGLVAYYKLDEESGDAISANSVNDLTMNGTVGNTTGLINYARNGFSLYNYFTNDSIMEVNATKNYSISLWVNITDTLPNDAQLIELGSGGMEHNFTTGIRISQSNTVVATLDEFGIGNLLVGNGTTTLNQNEWNHIVFTYDEVNKNGTIYLNGALENYTIGSLGSAFEGDDITIGKRVGNISQFGANNTIIDEVGLWNRTLTASEASELYNGGAGLPYGTGLDFIENYQYYNSTTYETADENFKINITYNDTLYTSATGKLNYDGINYTASTEGGGASINFTKSISINETVENRTFYWYIGLTNATSTYWYTSNSYEQNVSALNFSICDGSLTTPFVNYTFKDESTSLAINASISSAKFDYYLGSGDVKKTYNYNSASAENPNYTFCATPNRTINLGIDMDYLSTDYPQRTYTDNVTYSNTTTSKVLYLLGVTDGLYVTFQVLNSADQILSGVSTTVELYQDLAYTQIASGTTDDAGSITFWLNSNYQHRFNFTKTGYDDYSVIITPTQSSYTVTMSGESQTQNNTFQGIDYSVRPINNSLYNDTIYTFAFNLTSSYWEIDSYGFNLRLANGTTLSGGSTSVEDNELTLDYNVTNQTIIYMDYYWVINGNYTNVTRYWTITNTKYTGWSIATFFTDLTTYLDSGLFGIDDFGRYLIVFLILFMITGIVSYKFGVSSPLAVSTIIFAVVFFFDVVVGLIPDIRGIDNLLTYIASLILTLSIFMEVRR